MPVGIVDSQRLRGLVRRGAHAIDAAVAHPGDEPSRQQNVRRRTQRHGRRAGGSGNAGDTPANLAVGTEQRVADCRSVDPAAVQRSVQAGHQFTACLRRHRATTHAVGNDEERRGPVKAAVPILVDLSPPAAGARRRHFEADPGRLAYGVSAGGGAVARRLIALRECRFVRRDEVHERTSAGYSRLAAAIVITRASIEPVGIPARDR